MNVFIAGMVRAGSMWTYNVTRASLRRAGIWLIPGDDIPVDEKALLRTALQKGVTSPECYCIKTHEYLPLDIPNTRFICNYRDVRDAMLSHMRFMHLDFELGLQMVQAYMDLTDHYCGMPRENVLKMRYDDMMQNPVRTVSDINSFLGMGIDRKHAKELARRYSKSEVKKILNTIDAVDLDVSGRPLDQGAEQDYTSAPNVDGTRRVYHRKSGFSQNHITSTSPGEWRSVLTGGQQQRLMSLSGGWLTRYGFPL